METHIARFKVSPCIDSFVDKSLGAGSKEHLETAESGHVYSSLERNIEDVEDIQPTFQSSTLGTVFRGGR